MVGFNPEQLQETTAVYNARRAGNFLIAGQYQHAAASFSYTQLSPVEIGEQFQDEGYESFVEPARVNLLLGLSYSGLIEPSGLTSPDLDDKAYHHSGEWPTTNRGLNLEVAKEYGDMLWYLAKAATADGRTFDSVLAGYMNRRGLHARFGGSISLHKLGVKLADQPDPLEPVMSKYYLQYQLEDFAEPLHISEPMCRLAVVNRLLNRTRKSLNKEEDALDGPWAASDMEPVFDLETAIGDSVWLISWLGARTVGMSLAQIAQLNLYKLTDRKNRNVLIGSGDNR